MKQVFLFTLCESSFLSLKINWARSIGRISEKEYAKVLLQISFTVIFDFQDTYFKQISRYCSAMNAKTTDF